MNEVEVPLTCTKRTTSWRTIVLGRADLYYISFPRQRKEFQNFTSSFAISLCWIVNFLKTFDQQRAILRMCFKNEALLHECLKRAPTPLSALELSVHQFRFWSFLIFYCHSSLSEIHVLNLSIMEVNYFNNIIRLHLQFTSL